MIKVAIIGYGYMGEIRRTAIESNPNLSLILICDTDPQKLSGTLPFAVTRNPNDVLESNADLVFVCTPNNLIPELTIACLKKGKHVFVEKPPGRCLQDIIAIRRQEELSPGCKLMFGFNHRYHPAILHAKEWMDSGKLGKLLWIRGIYGKPVPQNFFSSWRSQKETSGGGILLDQGIHMLDLFNLFCGDFENVKAHLHSSNRNIGVEDHAFVIVSNQRGQSASLHSCSTLWKHTFNFEMGLDGGHLKISGFLSKTGSYGPETLTVGRHHEAGCKGSHSEVVTCFEQDLSWVIEVNNMVTCIQEDRRVEQSSSLDALKAMTLIEKAYDDSGFLSPS